MRTEGCIIPLFYCRSALTDIRMQSCHMSSNRMLATEEESIYGHSNSGEFMDITQTPFLANRFEILPSVKSQGIKGQLHRFYIFVLGSIPMAALTL